MHGRHKVIVQNNKLHYEFIIKRNITIVQGDSATGKTTLVDMIDAAVRQGESSGIDLICDVPCRVIAGNDWELILSNTKNHIIFIDEENSFINTQEFAEKVNGSDNYFVLITRESLYNLPYSVEEIYGIKSSGKYQNTELIYQQTYQIYPRQESLPIKPRKIITEDSKAGFNFFENVCKEAGISCESAHGKSNIFSVLKKETEDELCVIADGAAFGSEMDKVFKAIRNRKNIKLYLPESFEWIILKSGLIDGNAVKTILAEPEDYIDSTEYISWERFFEKLLVEQTDKTYLKYSKSKLNEAYLHEKNRSAILNSLAEGYLQISATLPYLK